MANLFKRFTSANVGTTVTAIGSYVVPAANAATVIGLSISNISANSINVAAELVNTAAESVNIIKSAPIPAGSTLVVIGGDQKIVMAVGDSIQVKSDTATSVDAILSLLESTQ